MSIIKISELADAPGEGQGRKIHFEHPFTYYRYDIALFKAGDKYYAITDACKHCGGSLGRGRLEGLLAYCSAEDHPWNIKTGVYKFDRTRVLPTYNVSAEPDGLYINI
ncbi:MAG: hypothetical protein HY580_00575 [Nitrospinae bacterium]|nr:hypothetical protein [Nitrospinota bacterium]